MFPIKSALSRKGYIFVSILTFGVVFSVWATFCIAALLNAGVALLDFSQVHNLNLLAFNVLNNGSAAILNRFVITVTYIMAAVQTYATILRVNATNGSKLMYSLIFGCIFLALAVNFWQASVVFALIFWIYPPKKNLVQYS